MVVVVGRVVVHILTVYVTVELVSKSSMLCTMLHGTVDVLLAIGVVVGVVVDPGLEVMLRNSRTLTQKSCVPAAATEALHISRPMISRLTIRKTGFSAVNVYAMRQSFIFLHMILRRLSFRQERSRVR